MNEGISAGEFKLLQRFIEEKFGILLGEEKLYLIESRLSKLLAESGLPNLEALFNRIIYDEDLRLEEKVVDAITTNETLWFRDKTPWQIVEDLLMPVYVEELRKGTRSKVRIWSAACSSGQEPYSIAMCIDRYVKNHGIADIALSDFEILATDISNAVLQSAQAGRYDNVSIMRGLDDSYRDRYFTCQGRIWSLDERIKNSVTYRQFNLCSNIEALGMFDVIFCRYAMIYFSEAFKRELTKRLSGMLKTGGVLFIGASELFPDDIPSFTAERHNNGMYYKAKR